MTEMKKITAFVPAGLLASAQEETGVGISETLRIGLQKIAHERFYKGMQELRGKVDFDYDLDASREDKDYDFGGDR
jgi:hypothetical protein